MQSTDPPPTDTNIYMYLTYSLSTNSDISACKTMMSGRH